MLAERLRDAGYETAGFSENPWISIRFNANQGFDHFRQVGRPGHALAPELNRWLGARNPDKPFFLFINIIDAHAPNSVRPQNPYLPAGVSREQAAAISQSRVPYVCSRVDRSRELEILKGLYLGDIAAGDRKLASTLAALGNAGADSSLISIVTSDHGEHFGENRFFRHVTGLLEPLTHVPLVVHGLPNVAPGVVEIPVHLAGITPSILQWLNLPIPDGLASPPFPTSEAADSPEFPLVTAPRIISERFDPAGPHAPDRDQTRELLRIAGTLGRGACQPSDRVFGGSRTIIEYPYKLTWYEKYPPALHDLGVDPSETRDIAQEHPELVAKLLAKFSNTQAEPVVQTDVSDSEAESSDSAPPGGMTDDIEAQLRALGYLGDDPSSVSPSTQRLSPDVREPTGGP
jgi:arylsulfatase A-like enzyme